MSLRVAWRCGLMRCVVLVDDCRLMVGCVWRVVVWSLIVGVVCVDVVVCLCCCGMFVVCFDV